MNRGQRFLYIINYSPDEEDLASLELKCLLGERDVNKYIISEKIIDPSNSPFIKERLSIEYEADSLEDLIHIIEEGSIFCEDFKVNFVKTKKLDIEYVTRLSILKDIGMRIHGEADIYNPKVEFGVACVNDKWFFGNYAKHNNKWHIHDKKPCTYSNSLNYKVARSLVNIATEGDYNLSLIDPCCGVGTVLLEAQSLGVRSCGCEINPMIGERAKINLKFFGYDDVVVIKDMHLVDKMYDTCIIDLPYGLFNPITRDQQEKIIETSRKISKKLVLVTHEKMDNIIINSGFYIDRQCTISKGKFKRYVTVGI